MKTRQPVILNSKGEPIVLNAMEKAHAEWSQRQVNERFGNSLGFEVQITTLTAIAKKVSEQKLFELAPADYVPIKIGDGAWSTNITTYRSFMIAGQFEDGIINNGGQNDRLAVADAGVDALNILTYNWAMAIGYSIPELEQASRSGNWDLVSAKLEALKKTWDLGIQRIAFLGARGNNSTGGACLGLLNQSGVTNNTTIITQPISNMSTTDLKQFCATIIESYRSNVARSSWPTHFVMPESDFNGLAAQASADFPIKSTLEVLEDMFKVITRNKGFKILPCAYGDDAYSDLGYQVYALYNYDEKSIRMDIPVDFTNTLANSINNFQFQQAAYGSYTGVLAYRPLEIIYYTY